MPLPFPMDSPPPTVGLVGDRVAFMFPRFGYTLTMSEDSALAMAAQIIVVCGAQARVPELLEQAK